MEQDYVFSLALTCTVPALVFSLIIIALLTTHKRCMEKEEQSKESIKPKLF